MPNNIKVLIVGAGIIAQEYVKVSIAQNFTPVVITRGQLKAKQLHDLYPHVKVETGGLENFLYNNECPLYAIVAAPVEYLATATKLLINNGCKHVLVEKPLTLNIDEASEILRLSKDNNCEVVIAFNRRSYQSVIHAKKLIQNDGGISSIHFDFTEAIFRIDPGNYTEDVTKFWGIANSSHVIDTAFYLAGKPKWIECRQYGNSVAWHQAGSIFTGFGETEYNVPFTYHSNWGAPGRWNIEVMTPKRKLMFSPMERLKQQVENSFFIEEVETDYDLDIKFKPGFYWQVQQFFMGKGTFALSELESEMAILNRIFNYSQNTILQ